MESFFQTHAPDLVFERRHGQFWDLPAENRHKLFTLTELLLAFASSILELPHEAKKGKGKIIRRVPRQIFHPDHPPELYLAAARLYLIARQRTHAQDAQGFPSFAHHLSFGLRITLISDPLPAKRSRQIDFAATILDELKHAASIQRKLKRAFKACREMLEQSSNHRDRLLLADTTVKLRKLVS